MTSAPTFQPTWTRGAALLVLRRALLAAGLDEAELDARLLLQSALDLSAVALLARPETPLGEAGARRLETAARRRLAREPVARILGRREFWGLDVGLSPDTLVPRPDTETLVAAALDACPGTGAPLQVLDLGTGSGCLLLAVLSERPCARGLGVDRSLGALRAARASADALGFGRRCAFLAADWGAAIQARFDLVLSNPPYIASADIADLAPEVARHDPRAALDGGPDGLGAYRSILPMLPGLLADAGVGVIELGQGQAGAVAAIAQANGLVVSGFRDDLSGRPRAVSLRRRPR